MQRPDSHLWLGLHWLLVIALDLYLSWLSIQIALSSGVKSGEEWWRDPIPYVHCCKTTHILQDSPYDADLRQECPFGVSAGRRAYPSDSVTAGLAQTLLSAACQFPKWVIFFLDKSDFLSDYPKKNILQKMMDTLFGNEPPQRLFGQAVALWPDQGVTEPYLWIIYIHTHVTLYDVVICKLSM